MCKFTLRRKSSPELSGVLQDSPHPSAPESTVPNRRALSSPDNLGHKPPFVTEEVRSSPGLQLQGPAHSSRNSHSHSGRCGCSLASPWWRRVSGSRLSTPAVRVVGTMELVWEWTCGKGSSCHTPYFLPSNFVSNNMLATQLRDTRYYSIIADTRCHLWSGDHASDTCLISFKLYNYFLRRWTPFSGIVSS